MRVVSSSLDRAGPNRQQCEQTGRGNALRVTYPKEQGAYPDSGWRIPSTPRQLADDQRPEERGEHSRVTVCGRRPTLSCPHQAAGGGLPGAECPRGPRERWHRSLSMVPDREAVTLSPDSIVVTACPHDIVILLQRQPGRSYLWMAGESSGRAPESAESSCELRPDRQEGAT